VSAFGIDRTEVTQGAYSLCVAAGVCAPSLVTATDPRLSGATLPVVGVSHREARQYCAFVGGRLPSEAEWERAARGAAPRRFPWGDLPNPKLANHGALDLGALFDPDTAEPLLGIPDPSDGFAGLAPVGSFPASATPEGLLDLAGNVAEWVADRWSNGYSTAPVGNPQGPPSGALRVVRGGSYRHPLVFLRGSARDRRPPSAREPTIGFRCARDAKS